MAQKPVLLSLKQGPRKHVLIVATDQSIQSSTYKTPALLAFCFHFPSLRKGQCVVQAGELKGLSLSPKCVLSPPPAPLNWHLMSRSQVCEAGLYQSFTRDHCFSWILYGGGVENQFSQQVLIRGSCHY